MSGDALKKVGIAGAKIEGDGLQVGKGRGV